MNNLLQEFKSGILNKSKAFAGYSVTPDNILAGFTSLPKAIHVLLVPHVQNPISRRFFPFFYQRRHNLFKLAMRYLPHSLEPALPESISVYQTSPCGAISLPSNYRQVHRADFFAA